MIIDQSGLFYGISSSRMSRYLTLCKLDVLVRNTEHSVPSRYVDRPGKAGTAGTITNSESPVSSNYDYPDHVLIACCLNQALNTKQENGLVQEGLNLKPEAGSAILQQDSSDNFTNLFG